MYINQQRGRPRHETGNENGDAMAKVMRCIIIDRAAWTRIDLVAERLGIAVTDYIRIAAHEQLERHEKLHESPLNDSISKTMRIEEGHWERFREAADQAGMSLSRWIVAAALRKMDNNLFCLPMHKTRRATSKPKRKKQRDGSRPG